MSKDRTIDVGYVHVLTDDRSACVFDCPHPDHRERPVRPGGPHENHEGHCARDGYLWPCPFAYLATGGRT